MHNNVRMLVICDNNTFRNQIITCCVCLAPIYLLNSNRQITAFIGDTVRMQIFPLGFGQQSYRWTKRGRRNRRIKAGAIGINSTQLILPSVTLSDSGRYLFTSKSAWSTNQTRVDLKVTCKLILYICLSVCVFVSL